MVSMPIEGSPASWAKCHRCSSNEKGMSLEKMRSLMRLTINIGEKCRKAAISNCADLRSARRSRSYLLAGSKLSSETPGGKRNSLGSRSPCAAPRSNSNARHPLRRILSLACSKKANARRSWTCIVPKRKHGEAWPSLENSQSSVLFPALIFGPGSRLSRICREGLWNPSPWTRSSAS